MNKKYLILISSVIIITMCASTSSASFLLSNDGIYKRLQQVSDFRKVMDRVLEIIPSKDNSVSIDVDEDDTDGDIVDEDDGEYDDGEHDDNMDPDDPDKNGVDTLLPNVLEEDFYWTPDNGDEPVIEEDNLQDTPTVDIDGEVGQTLNEEPMVDEDGEIGMTIDRIVEVLNEINTEVESVVKTVVDRTYAPGTTESDEVAENIVDTVVVVGESTGTAENNVVDNVVVTDNN